ncbi:MAG TPA: SpoIIE family protein phosphatase [Candidatus Elarobacter sp.]|jgi:PAS domain S-box-containing protein
MMPERLPDGLPPIDLATLDLLPDPAWVTPSEPGVAYFNAAWLAFTGAPARTATSAEFLGFIHPGERDRLLPAWAASIRRGERFAEHFRIRRADGTYCWFLMRAVPIAPDGAHAGWLGTLVDIDAERATRDELVAAEARARSIADAIPQLIGITAPDGSLVSVNATHVAYTGKSIDEIRESGWTALIHPDDVDDLVTSWQHAVLTGEAYDTQYRMRRRDGVYRWFLNKATPVRDADGTISAWIGTCTDIDERKRAEDALRVVIEATSAFAGTLDPAVALQRLADICATHLADWCGVYVYDSAGKLKPVAIAHTDPSRVRFVREYIRRYPGRGDDPAAVVASTGVPLRIDAITDDMYDVIDDPEQRDAVKSLGLRAILYVPLGVEDERYGVFSLAISESERAFTDEDQQLATLIAQRASIAVGNARLYERQREVARTLQAAFLPPGLPHADGVRFDAAYAPGTRDLTVGGDWYDAFPYAHGAFAFSIGDVAGHGLDAAVPMGKMRQTFRALAAVETDPARALGGADAVLRGEHPDIFVTAFVATYDLRSGVLRYANAGHPSPFVRRPDGGSFRLEAGGVPLGLGAFDTLRTQEASLARGDLLVAFTDGLIETTQDIDEGERAVAKALAHPAFGFCVRPAALLRAMVVPSLPRDDIAILTLRAGGGADWSFDANDARAAQAARRAFVARLYEEGAGDEDRPAFEIVFGEIVGNAARYTPGPLELALRRDGARLVLYALDRGPGFDWDAAPPRDAYAESGRGLFLIASLGRDVRAEHIAGYGTYLEVTLATR